MTETRKSGPRRFLPSQADDVIGTLRRVLGTGDKAAMSAVLQTASTIALTPLDMALSLKEARLYREASPPHLPIVFVCGPARSGTSLTAQVLIRHLPVSYFSNVVGLFPRAPLTASKLLPGALDRNKVQYASFYGKSRGLAGPNDALVLWDRWMGADRNTVPHSLNPESLHAMAQFFGAWQTGWQRPMVTKNNRLYAYGAAIAATLPTAHFICLQRDAAYLAQSQLIARRLLLGRDDVPYGIRTPEYDQLARPANPAEDACAYVASQRMAVARTREEIGGNRFWVLSYEQFCRDPNVLLERVAHELLGSTCEPLSDAQRTNIKISSRQLVDDATFAMIKGACERLGMGSLSGEYFL